MRLPSKAPVRALVVYGLAVTLGACALIPGGGDRVASATGDPAFVRSGPMADFPMVLGEAFSVDGTEYVPADVASYDAVGYATLDGDGGQGVTVAHKTLPLPSYVELTSLETGRTILARVERRGPMTGSRIVALSQGAQAQLGSSDGTPVRVRRVNPLEVERAELRAGRSVTERMDTPRSLLAVLARKLPPLVAPPAASVAPAPQESADFAQAFAGQSPSAAADSETVNVAAAVAPPVARSGATEPADAAFVIQAAAFASEANAARAATEIGGTVTQSGRFYRVRTGPYATRGQAEAALAKVRAAGYSDARVLTAG